VLQFGEGGVEAFTQLCISIDDPMSLEKPAFSALAS
jgi:hypothetical protein